MNKALLGKLGEGFDALKELALKQLEFSTHLSEQETERAKVHDSEQTNRANKQIEVVSGQETERAKVHDGEQTNRAKIHDGEQTNRAKIHDEGQTNRAKVHDEGQTNRHNHSETEQTERTRVVCALNAAATNSTAVLPQSADEHEVMQHMDSVTHDDSAHSDGHVMDACPAQRLFRSKSSAICVPKALHSTPEKKSRSGARTSGRSGASGESGSEIYRKTVDPDNEAAYQALCNGDFVVHLTSNQVGMIQEIFPSKNLKPGDDRIKVEKHPKKEKTNKTTRYMRKHLRLATSKEKRQAVPKAPTRNTVLPMNPAHSAARLDQKSVCSEAYPTLKLAQNSLIR